MKKLLFFILINFLFLSTTEAAYGPAEEDPELYRSDIVRPLFPEMQLSHDRRHGFVRPIFIDNAKAQETLGISGEHRLLIKNPENPFIYQTAGSSWFGIELHLPQENMYRLHFNLLNASIFSDQRPTTKSTPPLSGDYTSTRKVFLMYKSPDGVIHRIKLDKNLDVFDLRLGPRCFLNFSVEGGSLCDVIEVLIYQSLVHSLNDTLKTLNRLRRKSRSAVGLSSAPTSDIED